MRCFIFKIYEFKCSLLFRSTWEWLIIWQPLAVSSLPRAIGSKICIFQLVYKSMLEFLNGTRVTCWSGLNKLWKGSKMAEKYLWKSSIFRNVTGCNIFSYFFQRFPCISKLILQDNVCKYIIQKYAFFVRCNSKI